MEMRIRRIRWIEADVADERSIYDADLQCYEKAVGPRVAVTGRIGRQIRSDAVLRFVSNQRIDVRLRERGLRIDRPEQAREVARLCNGGG